MTQLFLSNVPHNCQESDVRQWIESKGFAVNRIHVIRDLVANASPAFAYVTLLDVTQNRAAIQLLNGQKLKDRVLQVKEDWRDGSQSQARIEFSPTHEQGENTK